MTEMLTDKPPMERREDRPAPGFEVFSDGKDYVVTYEDIQARPSLEGVVLIRQASFGHSNQRIYEKRYYTRDFEAVVDLERWDTDNGDSCPHCGSTQAVHSYGGNGMNASYERLDCNACGEEIFHHLRT
jgi:hypothetical protein